MLHQSTLKTLRSGRVFGSDRSKYSNTKRSLSCGIFLIHFFKIKIDHINMTVTSIDGVLRIPSSPFQVVACKTNGRAKRAFSLQVYVVIVYSERPMIIFDYVNMTVASIDGVLRIPSSPLSSSSPEESTKWRKLYFENTLHESLSSCIEKIGGYVFLSGRCPQIILLTAE